MIRLRVLGPVELKKDDGGDVRTILAQPKRLALLVALVVGPAGFRRRDALLGLLWPELDQVHARAALNQAVRFLRKELGDSSGMIILSRGAEELGVATSGFWCDAMAFRDHAEAGRFGDALELYRGDLLEGFFADHGAGFQEWLDRERGFLRLTAAKVARAVAGLHERSGDLTPAVAAARRAVDLADADERVVRELMQLLDRHGDRAGAIQAFEAFARRLSMDYGASPAPETRLLMEQIRTRGHPTAPVAVDPPPSANNKASALIGMGAPASLATSTAADLDGRPRDATMPDDNAAAQLGAGKTTPALDARSVIDIVVRRSLWLFAGAAIGALATRCALT